MRAMIASGIEPSAIAGRIRCLRDVPERVQVAREDRVEDVEVRRVLDVDQRPRSGRRSVTSPSCTAKMYLSMIARKKIGIEIPISDTNEADVVDRPSRSASPR